MVHTSLRPDSPHVSTAWAIVSYEGFPVTPFRKSIFMRSEVKETLSTLFRFKTREPCFCVLRHRQEPKHCWTTSRHVSPPLFICFTKKHYYANLNKLVWGPCKHLLANDNSIVESTVLGESKQQIKVYMKKSSSLHFHSL